MSLQVCIQDKLNCTYKLEAAGDTGLWICPAKGRHLSQEARDVDTRVQKLANSLLVREAIGIRDQPEQIYKQKAPI